MRVCFRKRLLVSGVFLVSLGLYIILWSDASYLLEQNRGNTLRQHNRQTTADCSFESKSIDSDFLPKQLQQTCQNIQIYPHSFVHLKNVVINPEKAKSQIGGENILDVMGQSTYDEDLQLRFGYFIINCQFLPQYYTMYLDENSKHLIQILEMKNGSWKYEVSSNSLTVAVQRVDYANLYHTMTEWYNVFLVMHFFRTISNCQIDVLFLDGHPSSDLDTTWSVLFGKFTRASFLKRATVYRNLIWGIPGRQSPMNDHRSNRLPLAESFRNFFLRKHGIHDAAKNNCQHFKILFIWRHDYISHPRNPSGTIPRKIKNEIEILDNVKSWYPHFDIEGVQMDILSMGEQLLRISRTNILIGMHGAGMSHVLFLPKNSGVIELFPINTYPSNMHFKAMARWRNLYYTSWQNVQKWNDFPDEGSTYIPLSVLKYLIRKTRNKICKL